MGKLHVDDNLLRLVLILFLLFILYNFILVPIGFLLPIRLHANDTILKSLKTIKSANAQIDNIIVLKIDDSTLNESGKKWTADRTFTAQLINKIAEFQPKIIGIDLILFGKSNNPEEDEQLTQALRDSNNTVLASIISENGEYIKPPIPFLEASKGEGFVNVVTDLDYKTRRVKLLHKTSSSSDTHLSFETILASLYKGIKTNKIYKAKRFNISSG